MLQSRLVQYSVPLCRRLCIQHRDKAGSTLLNVRYLAPTSPKRTLSMSTRQNGPTDSAASEVVESVPFLLQSEVGGKIVDPAFTDMGLATGWLPYNYIQSLYESLHNLFDQPWWVTIVLATLAIRVLTFPLYVSSKKFSINSNNKSAGQQKIMKKFDQAKQDNDYMRKVKYEGMLMDYMKKHKIGPLNMLITMPLPVIFMSSMIAIRKMTQLPVPSLDAEPFFWISSLCAPDPYRIIQLTTGVVLGLTLRTVLNAGHVGAKTEILKKIGPYLPWIPPVFCVMMMGKTASIVSIYILMNGIVTWGSTLLIMNPTVKKALNIPELTVKTVKKGERQGLKVLYKEYTERFYKQNEIKSVARKLKSDRKREEKQRKKELKGDPPVTYQIGLEAKEKRFVPDFEREWKPKLTRRQDYM